MSHKVIHFSVVWGIYICLFISLSSKVFDILIILNQLFLYYALTFLFYRFINCLCTCVLIFCPDLFRNLSSDLLSCYSSLSLDVIQSYYLITKRLGLLNDLHQPCPTNHLLGRPFSEVRGKGSSVRDGYVGGGGGGELLYWHILPVQVPRELVRHRVVSLCCACQQARVQWKQR